MIQACYVAGVQGTQGDVAGVQLTQHDVAGVQVTQGDVAGVHFNFISFILIYYYTATSLEYYCYC